MPLDHPFDEIRESFVLCELRIRCFGHLEIRIVDVFDQRPVVLLTAFLDQRLQRVAGQIADNGLGIIKIVFVQQFELRSIRLID